MRRVNGTAYNTMLYIADTGTVRTDSPSTFASVLSLNMYAPILFFRIFKSTEIPEALRYF